jgi:hypothetical protein
VGDRRASRQSRAGVLDFFLHCDAFFVVVFFQLFFFDLALQLVARR